VSPALAGGLAGSSHRRRPGDRPSEGPV